MIEVFITNIQSAVQAGQILNAIKDNGADLKIDFDFEETPLPFPCGHTILRVKGTLIIPHEIRALLIQLGFEYKILEDKICI